MPAPPSPPDRVPALTVLAGHRTATTLAVGEALLCADRDLVLVHHDLRDIRSGRVHRTVRTAEEVLARGTVDLAHGCVSCTLREDVLPTLVRLARSRPDHDLLLVLPDVVEPEAVAAALAVGEVDGEPVARWLRVDTVTTVVDGASFLADLSSEEDLADRGRAAAADDTRGVAEVVARQVEGADAVLLVERDGTEPYEAARLRVLLQRLAPPAVLLGALVRPGAGGGTWVGLAPRDLLRTGRHDPAAPPLMQRGLEGLGFGVSAPEPDCGVVSTVYRSRRPFHPGRLDAALGGLVQGVLRSRGHLWLASQPEAVVGWESAGSALAMGAAGRWLATLGEQAWREVTPARRTAASLLWDPYYGDRSHDLCFVGLGLDGEAVHACLDACLLTDGELAEGEEAWRAMPDPFAGCFEVDPADAA